MSYNVPSSNNIVRTGGLGRISISERSYTAICMGGVASGDIDLNTVYEFNNIQDAIALGINAAYDVANVILVYKHISEFFRKSPSGRLYVMLVSQSATLTEICDVTTTYGLFALLTNPLCAGLVRYAGACLNPASGYMPTVTDQINEDVIAGAGPYTGAVVNAQALVAQLRGMQMPVRVFVEARDFGGTASTLLDATAAACNDVELIMASDNDVANINALYNGYAAIGTALGVRSNYRVQEMISKTANGGIEDASIPAFVNPGYSGNGGANLLSNYTRGYWVAGVYTSGQQDEILNKGFIGPATYGVGGVFFAGDVTATASTDDFFLGPNGLVINEAIRIVYLYVKTLFDTDVNVDDTTGKLDPLVCASWQADITKSLTDNLNQNVSGVSALIDPNQDILGTDILQVQVNIVPKGYAHTITTYIGLSNPF